MIHWFLFFVQNKTFFCNCLYRKREIDIVILSLLQYWSSLWRCKYIHDEVLPVCNLAFVPEVHCNSWNSTRTVFYYFRTFFCSMLTWSLITLEARLIKWSRWQVHEGICDASSVSCWHWNLEAAAVFLKPRNRSSTPPDSSHPVPLHATAHVQRRVLVHAPSSTDP